MTAYNLGILGSIQLGSLLGDLRRWTDLSHHRKHHQSCNLRIEKMGSRLAAISWHPLITLGTQTIRPRSLDAIKEADVFDVKVSGRRREATPLCRRPECSPKGETTKYCLCLCSCFSAYYTPDRLSILLMASAVTANSLSQKPPAFQSRRLLLHGKTAAAPALAVRLFSSIYAPDSLSILLAASRCHRKFALGENGFRSCLRCQTVQQHLGPVKKGAAARCSTAS
jgi:hypothetical protein